MNKLKTNIPGGMPLELDDLNWQEASVRDAFYGLLSAFGIAAQDSFILSGCIVTINGNDYTTTPGYISLNGEILKVDAQTITKPFGKNIAWQEVTTYDPSGSEIFADGQTHDTYEVRKGGLIAITPNAPPTHMPYNAPLLWDKILGKEGWHEIGSGTEPSFATNWGNNGGGYSTCAFKKNSAGTVYLKGRAIFTGSPNPPAVVLFTLPSGYRPADIRTFYCFPDIGNQVTITINDAGEVYCVGFNDISSIILDGIVFSI